MINKTEILKDLANRKLDITRDFNAPVEKVWRAWTEQEILDKWWAPRPWKAETKMLSFTNDGLWLYCMVSPDESERHWCRVDIKTVSPRQSFTSVANFCDEAGNINKDMPPMYWSVAFRSAEAGTRVGVTLSFDSETDLEKIIQMGFEAGFTMALGNLDEVLAE